MVGLNVSGNELNGYGYGCERNMDMDMKEIWIEEGRNLGWLDLNGAVMS